MSVFVDALKSEGIYVNSTRSRFDVTEDMAVDSKELTLITDWNEHEQRTLQSIYRNVRL